MKQVGFSFSLVTLSWVIIASPISAQVTSDDTLTNPTQVEQQGNVLEITEGTTQGSNLFHSFQDFSVPQGMEAFFNNNTAITNIFSRITGGDISIIEGLIRANGSANLFLLNPNGIIFGENASLNIGGSFLATSAQSILFDDGTIFSATDTQTQPLLTISVPMGIGLPQNPEKIVHRSQALGLQVAPGKTLALLGGEVSLEGGNITAPGGRVHLGGLTEIGTIGLNNDGSLSFPEGVAKANVLLMDDAIVDVLAEQGGSINIDARNLELRQASQLITGTRAGLSNPSAIGGDIDINITNNTVLSQGSIITSVIQSEAVGNSGEIDIATTNLSLTEGSRVEASTQGRGNAAQITIDASGNILADGIDESGIPSRISSRVEKEGIGNSEGIDINTTNLSLTDGGRVDASTFGEGNAGKITINTSGSILVDGTNESRITSFIGDKAIGDSEGIDITTTDLSLTEGGRVDARTLGQGNGGKITINASGNLFLDGTNQSGVASSISSRVGTRAIGDSQGIDIKTTNLSLTEGGRIDASTVGAGNAGKITINASGNLFLDGTNESGIASFVGETGIGNSEGIDITATDLSLTGGGKVIASTSRMGNSGAITINTSGSILVDGTNESGVVSSIESQVTETGIGDSDTITITTTDLSLSEGGRVTASTLGQGDAGKITINASGSILVDGTNESGITSFVGDTGIGNSEGIEITTTDLSLTEGGRVIASTFGQGNAGKITINALGSILIDGTNESGITSRISSRVGKGAKGKSEGIDITTTNLSLTEGGRVTASTSGTGNAGAITIDASGNILAKGTNRSGVFSSIESQVRKGGIGKSEDITITTNDLSLTQGGRVDASTFGQGNAGNIIINASGNILADNASGSILADENNESGITSIVRNGGIGNSGDITITTSDLSLTEGGRVSSSTFGRGDGGNIIIKASGNILADGEDQDRFTSRISSRVGRSGIGNSGDITIETNDLSLTKGGIVIANTSGQGNAGSITINASGTILADETDRLGAEETDRLGIASGISSRVEKRGVGDSGDITITTNDLSLTKGGIVDASTSGQGNAGNITINASGTILADNASGSKLADEKNESGIINVVRKEAIGNSGDITIETNDLSLVRGGRVSTSTFGAGDAGNITINASGNISVHGKDQSGFTSRISSREGNTGRGDSKNIDITTTNLSLRDGGTVIANTMGRQKAGNISITANILTATSGSTVETNTATKFKAGDITLNLSDYLFLSGEGTEVSAQTEGAGKAGAIEIDTPQLTVDQEASISAVTESSGNGGAISVNAPQAVFITDGGQLTVETSNAGKPGNITITTPRLTIGKNAEISATATKTSTNTEGGGSITINTSSLDLTGKLGIFAETKGKAAAGTLNIQPDRSRSNLDIRFTDTAIISSSTTGSGEGGDINLTAPEAINISGKGEVTVETRGSGDAGDINIETKNLHISNQTEISASTAGIGNAGNIILDVSDNIRLSGNGSGIFANTELNSAGNGGNILTKEDTTTKTITVENGAAIAVDSQGSGDGGNINLKASDITLDNGSITAETDSTEGGDITLKASDILQFSNNGRITASAGQQQAPGNGGNIKIESDFILAFPSENNNEITANAFTGEGGSINITANNILGRYSLTIDASSQFGLDGNVDINIPEVDPTSGIIELTDVPIDTEAILAQNLCKFEDEKIAKGSSFYITGRGGLTPTSTEPLDNLDRVIDWSNRDDIQVSKDRIVQLRQRSTRETLAQNDRVIQQAQGWVVTTDGNVWLTQNNPQVIPQNSGISHPDCQHSPKTKVHSEHQMDSRERQLQ